MNKINEAIIILKEIGLPKAQQNERSALTLLALLDLKKNIGWRESKKRNIRIHDILQFIQKNFGKTYAENTRETIRRQTLHQFEQAGIVIRNPDDLSRPTNSPKTTYAISDDALDVIKQFGTPKWKIALNTFMEKVGALLEKYEKRKQRLTIDVELSPEMSLKLSPGKHNELQSKIVKSFRPRFCPDSKIVYIGDTARKMLHLDDNLLKELNIPITEHDKLPDIVLYDARRNVLFLIEAVTAHGPMSPKRQTELERILEKCQAKRIYISAFLDFHEFKKHSDNIAWETEVWIDANPDHMIHFNGPKFFSVYEK